MALAVTALVAAMAGPAAAVDPPNWVAALYVEAQQMVGLRWTPVPGATGYKVLRSGTAGSGYAEIAATSSPQHFDGTVETGSDYYYVLQAVAGSEVSANSAEKSVKIPGIKKITVNPPDWRKIQAQVTTEFGKTTYKVGLSWTQIPGVVAYNVYRSEAAGKDHQLVGSVSEDQYVDTSVQEGKVYYYVLTALDNSFQETKFSSERSVTIEKPKEEKKIKEKLPNPKLAMKGSKKSMVITTSEGFTLGSVSDVVVDSDGNIYGGDISTSTVMVFNSEGRFLRAIGEKGKEEGKILYPTGLGIDDDDNIYVADRGVEPRIVVYKPNGQFIKQIIIPMANDEYMADFNIKTIKPIIADVAVAPDGRIYTADNSLHRIVMFDEDGEFIKQFGQAGGEPGSLNAPGWMAINDKGELHVCNGFNRRIEVFDLDGNFIRNYGLSKSFIGSFIGPTGITFDDKGRSIVVDASMATIQYFAENPETGNWDYLFHMADDKVEMDKESKQRPTFAIRSPGGVAYNADSGMVVFALSQDKQIMGRTLEE